MKKQRIIELKIEDDDLLSGVDQISLVDEPAIEYNWLAFKKEEQQFIIPEGQDRDFLDYFSSVGETIEDLEKEGWVEVSSTAYGKEDFAALSSDPNDNSELDVDDVRIRFRYGLGPQFLGQPEVIPTSREFCRDMVASNRVYTYEDISRINPLGGSPYWEYRGSYNCRHYWYQVVYKQEGRIINKASVNKGKVDDTEYGTTPSFGQPTTITTKTQKTPGTKRASLSSVKFYKDEFTLPLFEREEDAIDYSKLIGCEEGAHPHIIEGVTLWMPCASHPEDMDIDVSGLPPYVDQVPECDDCIKKRKKEEIYEQFETYNDYPKQASENAKVALRWAEENGWGDCGTAVGKQRANQLANGENISEETIARMAAFERHRQNSDKELGDGCGRLMWLAWGGDAGIEWAQRKLEQIRKEEMAELEDACWPGYEAIGTKMKDGREVPNCVPIQNKKVFSFQEEGDKMIVVGPAMIPNKKILRRDEMTKEIYSVYFSEETILQISEKFMKRGYTKENQHDILHLGPGEKDVYVMESWIIEDPQHDKAMMYGFSDLPKGTWMIKMRVLNQEVWKLVKKGELRGFSVSGFFEEIEQDAHALEFLKELAKILK